MKSSKHSWLLALAILMIGSTTSLAQGTIRLVQGQRAVNDKVTFVVEVEHRKNETPPYATAVEYMQIVAIFERLATGMVYVDGKGLGRFDESRSFDGKLGDVTYGRHTMTLVFANPTVVIGFSVGLSRGTVREILEGEEASVTAPTSLEQRVVELERKVHDLEAEITTLKKKRTQ